MVEKKQPSFDLDAIWRVELGLDLEERSVLEAEVLMWRICSAKHLSVAALNRALHDEWEPES